MRKRQGTITCNFTEADVEREQREHEEWLKRHDLTDEVGSVAGIRDTVEEKSVTAAGNDEAAQRARAELQELLLKALIPQLLRLALEANENAAKKWAGIKHACAASLPERWLSLCLVRPIHPMKQIITFVLTALRLSCASNSGVYRVSENTYQVTTRATWELGGRVGAMRMAMQEATKFCSEHGGKQLKVIKETDDYGHFQGGIVNLTFSCE